MEGSLCIVLSSGMWNQRIFRPIQSARHTEIVNSAGNQKGLQKLGKRMVSVIFLVLY